MVYRLKTANFLAKLILTTWLATVKLLDTSSTVIF